MQTSHNDGLVLKLTLALILFALAIAITELTGRALTGTPDADSHAVDYRLPRYLTRSRIGKTNGLFSPSAK